uniref:Uncharacterized protein n=1 Tax=Meloidogyne enterolobii TaxID=390850 RepID=A0A6V7V7Y1_MELEN|nr:unnamed protein product [Meloidogyne enterolobii]
MEFNVQNAITVLCVIMKSFWRNKCFCWEKSENETKMIKGARVCRDKCFVSRNFTTGNETLLNQVSH